MVVVVRALNVARSGITIIVFTMAIFLHYCLSTLGREYRHTHTHMRACTFLIPAWSLAATALPPHLMISPQLPLPKPSVTITEIEPARLGCDACDSRHLWRMGSSPRCNNTNSCSVVATFLVTSAQIFDGTKS